MKAKPVTGAHEFRAFTLADVEVREASAGSTSPGGFVGYAAVFDSLSQDLGGFREKIAPGAFDTAIVEDDVRALVNHDRNLVLARSKAGEGTLNLSSDAKGLRVEIPDLPNTSYARDLVESLRRGDVDQMSFGFVTVRDSWAYTQDGDPAIRTLEEVRLFDVSPVTYPAYTQTEAEARALAYAITEAREGKVLSQRSLGLVQGARDALNDLLAHASGEDGRSDDAVVEAGTADVVGGEEAREVAEAARRAWSFGLPGGSRVDH